MQKILVSIGLCLLITFSVKAQQGDLLKSEAIMYESQGNYEKASITYEKAAEAYNSINKQDTLCIFKAGQSYSRSKQYNKAIPFLTKCIELNYAEPGVYIALSSAYEGLKNKDKAESTLVDGIAKYPNSSAEFTRKLGYLYFNSGKYEQAVSSLKKALEASPNDETFLYLYGSSLDKMKKYDESVQAFEKILANNPSHKKTIVKLGLVYYKQTDSKYKSAKKRYAAIKKPSRVDYHNFTQKLVTVSKGYNKALPHLEKAHQLSPKNKAIISCLSVSYKRLKMKDKEAKMNALLK